MLEISAMSLEGRTLARIIKEFGDADQAIVADLLRSYYGRESLLEHSGIEQGEFGQRATIC